VGTRYFDYEETVLQKTDFPLFLSFGSWETPPPVQDDGFLFKFNLALDVESWLPGGGLAYLTVSEGYRNGGINALDMCTVPPTGQNVCVTPAEATFKPDTTTNYEVGLKTAWVDNRLTTDFAFYYIDWQDVQLTTITITGAQPITGNSSDADSIGAEFTGRFQINDRWAMYGAYAYNQIELSKDAPNSVGVRTDPVIKDDTGPFTPADAFKGDRLPGSPEHQGSFNVNYTTDIFQEMTLAVDYGFTTTSNILTKTGLRGRNQLTGTQSITDTSGEALGGFTLHNLSLTFSKNAWSAMLYTKNMFDKFALSGVRRDPDFIDKRADGEGIHSTTNPWSGAPPPGQQFTLRQYHHNVIQPRVIGADFRYFFAFKK
jgi:outer membrane receptor protein involved in Fe transport